jgi:glucodextranase-like protein
MDARYKLTAVLACAALLGVTLAACGGSSAPGAVHLTLTAPTDGAIVTVSRLFVTGAVEPANARVSVAGRSARNHNGHFGAWIQLRRGLTHIRVDARAPGLPRYRTEVAVRSIPPAPRRQTPGVAQALPAVDALRSDTWNTSVSTAWVNACVVGGGFQSYCECTLRYAMQVGRPYELVESILSAKATGRRPEWLTHAIAHCL